MRSHAEAPRTALQLILDLEFGSALIGKTILVTAFWAQTMLFVVLTFEDTHSATWVGLVLAAQLLPQLFLAMLSGSLADKGGPQFPVVTGGVFAGVGSIALAIWLVIPEELLGIPIELPLLVASTICGTGVALASAAMQAIPPRLSAPSEHATAMSLNFLPSALGRTLGPLVGASLSAVSGAGPTLALLGGTCLISASVFLFIRRLATPNVGTESPQGLRDVLRYMPKDKPLIAAIIAAAAISAAAEAAVTLAPPLGNLIGIGTSGAGWVTAAFGLGGLAGIVTFRICSTFLKPQSVGCLSMVVLGGCMGLTGLIPYLAFTTVMLVMGGASMVMGITAFGIIVQQRTPGHFLGRVMALWVMAFSGTRPLAGLLLGLTSDHLSTAAAVISVGILVVAATAFVYLLARSGNAPLADRPQGRQQTGEAGSGAHEHS